MLYNIKRCVRSVTALSVCFFVFNLSSSFGAGLSDNSVKLPRYERKGWNIFLGAGMTGGGFATQDDVVLVGASLRLGFSKIFLYKRALGIYTSIEAYGSVFGHNSHNGYPPYLSGGAAIKAGLSFKKAKTRVYAILASEYIAFNYGGIGTGPQRGWITLGAGAGVKHEIFPFLDMFYEFRSMFSLGTVVGSDLISGHFDNTMLVGTVGLEFKI